ncbi:hypothetical protein IFU02_020830 [Pantoea agglomerans]|uniref:hypothetical protein n=1 Tax=Enterobacter agglomerans TaxID=549 RepID=UPI001782C57C|nr:hypothetical protein [Pantoea agglomerans]WVL84887.1 hypothetical protein IFU02_020830 [Pantoea agglomerans]
MKLNTERCRKLISQLRFERDNGGMSNQKFDYLDALEIALPILEQRERGDGEWIEWTGGECLVTDDTIVAVKYRNGVSMPDQQAGYYEWNHGYGDLAQTRVDIIAYRIIPEQPTNQNGEQ